MKIWSKLPPNREAEGTLWVTEGENIIFGPVRCRGEADNSGAKAHGNVQEDPTRAYGDHPAGVYRVVRIVRDPEPASSYGPVFIALNPVSGEALEARRNGRKGFGIHGGPLMADGRLRPTHGCNRTDDESVLDLAEMIEPQLAASEVFCEVTLG